MFLAMLIFSVILSSNFSNQKTNVLNVSEELFNENYELIASSPSFFTFQKNITINHSKVSGTSDLLNFPLLISLFDSDLHDNCQADGDDIGFFIGGQQLFHEIERFNRTYNSTHAQLEAWINVPSLSCSTDTVIRMYYGNSTMSSQQNPESVWNSNYKGVWHLSEDPSGTINDSTSYDNDGTSDASMETDDQVNSQIGNGFEFNDVTDDFYIPDSSSLDLGSNFTVQAWVQVMPGYVPGTTYNESNRIFDKKELWSDSDGWSVSLVDDDDDSIEILGSDSNPTQIQNFTTSWSTGDWHQVTIVYDGTNVTAYRDGVSRGNVSITPVQDNDNPLMIGQSGGTGGNTWYGKMDEIRISTGARSADWIATEYNNQKDPGRFYTIKEEPLEVDTLYGTVKGKEWDDDTYSWLGVPYAKPPIGSLRWRSPQDPDPWSGIRMTTEFSEPCMQFANWMGTTNEEDILNTNVIGSEDCLYLNVWTPKQEDGSLPSNLPVYLWIHGGGNVVGQANWPMYHGENLANNANCIVVSINYRLEIVGWMYHWAFGEEGNPETPEWDPLDNSGNFAILDIIHALKFVKHNIENFGGDEDRITIAGQGAGGWNIYSLLTSPYLKQAYFDVGDPLFHRAVIQSGGLLSTEMDEGIMPVETICAQYLVYNGTAMDEDEACDMVDDEILWGDGQNFRSWLMNADMVDLFECRKNQSAEAGLEGVMSIPSMFGDGYVVAEDALEKLNSGDYIKVPTIIGCCEEEVKIFLAQMMDEGEYYDSMFRRGLPDNFTIAMSDLLASSGLTTEEINLIQAINASAGLDNENIRLYCVDIPAELMSQHRDDVFTYMFCWKAMPYPLNDSIGASHGMDLPFIFGNIAAHEAWPVNSTAWTPENEPGRIALSNKMIEHWSNFIYYGDPGGFWHPWKDPARYRMIFNATFTEDVSYCIWVSIDEVHIHINNPIDNQVFKDPPSFDIYFTPPYTINQQYTVGSYGPYSTDGTDTIDSTVWSYQPDGNVLLNFSADDGAGNSTYSIVTVIKDTIDPSISITSPTNSQIYSSSPPSYSISITENNLNETWYLVGGSPTKYFITGSPSGTIDSGAWAAGDQQGTITLTFYANDHAGNEGYDSVDIIRDTQVPIITINSPTFLDIYGAIPPDYQIDITETNTIVSRWYTINNSENIYFTPLSGTIDSDKWIGVSDGSVNLTFYAEDVVGNVGSVSTIVNKNTPPTWIEVPSDQTIKFGDSFSYNVNATDTSGIDHYSINASSTFNIDSSGVITNITQLLVGVYWVNVSAFDASNNYCDVQFKIIVQDLSAPTWIQEPETQIVKYGLDILYDVNATDLFGIDHYWINDTSKFKINETSGVIQNKIVLDCGEYWLEVRAYDLGLLYCSAIFKIIIHEHGSPEYLSAGINAREINPIDTNKYRVNFSFNLTRDTIVVYYSSILNPSALNLDDDLLFIEVFLNETNNLKELNITIEYLGLRDLEKLKGWWFNSSANAWEELSLMINGNNFTISVKHASIFALSGIEKQTGGLDDDSENGEGEGESIIIIIIIIIISGSVAGIARGTIHNIKSKKKERSIEEKPMLHSEFESEDESGLSNAALEARRKRERLMQINVPPSQIIDKRERELSQIPKPTKKSLPIRRALNKDEMEELAQTEEEIYVKKESVICLVHRGEIHESIYRCRQCQSFYCNRCAKVLKMKGENCWSCGSEINLPISDAEKAEFLGKNSISIIAEILEDDDYLKHYIRSDKSYEEMPGIMDYIFSVLDSEELNRIDLLNLNINEKKQFIMDIITLEAKERKQLIDDMLKFEK